MKTLVLGFAICVIVPCAAQAATGVVQFNGVVLSNCTISIGGPGVLDLSADGGTLSSKQGLGTPATAVVLTTGSGFHVDIGTPSSFALAPSGANGGVAFATTYNASGVTAAINVNGGVPTTLGIGVTNLTVNLAASRVAGFPAGVYSAQTTVTCE